VKPAYLYLRGDIENKNWLYVLDHSAPKEPEELSQTGRYRISPIFPVIPKLISLPEFKGSHFVGFFFYQHAFQALGYLLNQIIPENHERIWFSHGLASILMFSQELDTLCKVSSLYSKGLRGYEIWTLQDNLIIEKKFWHCKPTTYDPSLYSLIEYNLLSADLCHILDEFQNSINAAITRSAQYIPSHLLIYQQLVKLVNEFIEELLFLCGLSSRPPASFTEPGEILLENQIERQKMINQRTGGLVQINSTLSYVISQSYSGKRLLLLLRCICYN
jgi:hypothetical protein